MAFCMLTPNVWAVGQRKKEDTLSVLCTKNNRLLPNQGKVDGMLFDYMLHLRLKSIATAPSTHKSEGTMSEAQPRWTKEKKIPEYL